VIIDGDKTVELGVTAILVPLLPSQISRGLVWDRMGMVRNVLNVAVFVMFSTVFSFHFKQCKITWGLFYSAVTKHVECYGMNLQPPPRICILFLFTK
jgi:hypothetical protein